MSYRVSVRYSHGVTAASPLMVRLSALPPHASIEMQDHGDHTDVEMRLRTATYNKPPSAAVHLSEIDHFLIVHMDGDYSLQPTDPTVPVVVRPIVVRLIVPGATSAQVFAIWQHLSERPDGRAGPVAWVTVSRRAGEHTAWRVRHHLIDMYAGDMGPAAAAALLAMDAPTAEVLFEETGDHGA